MWPLKSRRCDSRSLDETGLRAQEYEAVVVGSDSDSEDSLSLGSALTAPEDGGNSRLKRGSLKGALCFLWVTQKRTTTANSAFHSFGRSL